MKALICEISWSTYYRGEEALYPSQYISNNLDSTNFINFDGNYYAYFNNQVLDEDIKHIDYLIFVAKHPKLGMRICGWYKDATIYKNMQTFVRGNVYYASCKDENAFLLSEKDRDFPLEIHSNCEWIEINKRLKVYLERTTKRINYHQNDINKAVNINLPNVKNTCEMIERAIMSNELLTALKITNSALIKHGMLASFIYYKAWILYLFLQYRSSTIYLSQIMNVQAYSDLVNYMLGNIYFELEDYEKCIKVLENVKKVNPDQTNYMLAQAYAMQGQVAFAKGAIEKALIIKPDEEAYISFKQSLKEWNHE